VALVSLQDVRVAFGGPELINGVTLQIERGERVCLSAETVQENPRC